MAAALVVSLAVVASMLRRPALRRIGLRNFSRRKWNTALVVAGSMVGTALISGSLVLNDSTARFQHDEARETLGEIDEIVQKTGQRLPSDRRPIPTFASSEVENITPERIREETGNAGADGVLGALTQEAPAETVARDDEEKTVSPAITVVGVNWSEMEEFGSAPPDAASRPAPAPGEVYVSEKLAASLGVEAGEALRVRGVSGFAELEVAEVLPERGISGYTARFSSSDGTALAGLGTARQLFGAGSGEVNTLFVSNEGGMISGLEETGSVTGALKTLLGGTGSSSFEVTEIKKDTIEQGGFRIGDIFLMISSFAILAGVLLIINIYTMLAEERKGELGILRAVALKRASLARVFVYEGFAYSLLASILGVFVGLGVAAALVRGLNQAASVVAGLFNDDLTIPFYAKPSSLVIALCAGLLMTFLAVLVASVRIGRLNIVSAIRDLPEQRPEGVRPGRLILQALLLVAGLALCAAGFFPEETPGSVSVVQQGYLMLLGPVVAAVGLGFLVSRIVGSRPLWTVIGAAILAYAYLANNLEPVARANETSPAIFFIEGVCMVLAASVAVTFNLAIVYGMLRFVVRLVPRLAPVLKVAVAYPAARRARTGFTLAMFALILYVVTVSAAFSATQNAASQSNRDEQLSGYDGFLQAGPFVPVSNFEQKVESNPTLRRAVTDTAKISAVGVTLPEYEASEYRTSFGPPTGQSLRGVGVSEYLTYVPDGYLDSTTDELAARADRFDSDREAWRALAKNPDLVMLTFPYNGEGDFQARPRLGPGDTLTLQDPLTGAKVEKEVAGRIEAPSGFSLGVINGVIASERARDQFSNLRPQETYLTHIESGADTDAVGRELNDEFAATGAQSYLVDDILGRSQAFIDTFVKIVQAFLAFGLVVGIAGLAVISARAVHERHREIGTLRAVGFKARTVGWQFVVENSSIALIGILIGVSVGTLGGYNLFTFAVDDPEAVFVFPWRQMLYIGAGVWAVSMLATVVPAIRASRVPPVEALRHEG